MSVNYELLKQSKSELIEDLSLYFKHIADFCKESYTYLSTHNTIEDYFVERINDLEEQSDNLYNDVLNSAIWIIQRNEPRASNLRFIISCINSAKELERTSDYILSITNFLKKRNIDKTLYTNFMDSFKQCSLILQKAYTLFMTRNYKESKQELKQFIVRYQEFLKTNTRTILKHFNTLSPTEENNKALIDLIQTINSLDRIVVHIYNVIKSFCFVDIN